MTDTNRNGLSTFGRAFWRATLDRAIKTAAQVPLTTWVAGDVVMNALDMDWSKVLGLALGGFILSVLTSISSAPIGPVDSPSTI